MWCFHCLSAFSETFLALKKNSPRYCNKFGGHAVAHLVQELRYKPEFDENPSSGSLVVPAGRTDRHDKIVTFRNFANAPKNHIYFFEYAFFLSGFII